MMTLLKRLAAIQRIANLFRQDGTAATAGHVQDRIPGCPAPRATVRRTPQLLADEFRHAGFCPEGVPPELLVKLIGEKDGGSLHGSGITYIWRHRTLPRPLEVQPAEYWPVRTSTLEPRLQPALGVRPRNQLNGSVVDLLKTLLNLLPPSLLSILVHLDVKTIQEGVNQRRPRLGGERQRFVQQLGSSS
jgi:hypothetical protein